MQDCEKFAFSMPSLNYQSPDDRYEWTVLPQGMANSPAFCQNYVKTLLSQVMQKPQATVYVYMDDIILGAPDPQLLGELHEVTQGCLQRGGLHVSADKIQSSPPFRVLGTQLFLDGMSPLKPQLTVSNCLCLLNSGIKGTCHQIWLQT